MLPLRVQRKSACRPAAARRGVLQLSNPPVRDHFVEKRGASRNAQPRRLCDPAFGRPLKAQQKPQNRLLVERLEPARALHLFPHQQTASFFFPLYRHAKM